MYIIYFNHKSPHYSVLSPSHYFRNPISSQQVVPLLMALLYYFKILQYY